MTALLDIITGYIIILRYIVQETVTGLISLCFAKSFLIQEANDLSLIKETSMNNKIGTMSHNY